MTTGGQSLSFCVLVRADAGCLLLADPAVHQVARQRQECPEADRTDREESDIAEPKAKRLTEKIARLRAQMRDLAAREEEVRSAPDQQVSLTDPDARAMTSAGRGTSIVGYNLQAAVDAEHHLIVAHELLNIGNDRGQLSSMAAKAKDAMGVGALDAIADKGYFKGEDIRICEGMSITAFVPRPLTSGAKAQGRFASQTSSIWSRKTSIDAPLAKI